MVFAACAATVAGGEVGQTDMAGWKLSLPGWKYEFPRDHGNHPGFKTEWWYFTGNLKAGDGREFGYQLTFFRQGIRPLDQRTPTASRFVVNDVPFVHFAISDLDSGKFYHSQLLNRGAFGEAGFADGERLAWVEGCEVRLRGDGGFDLVGQADGFALNLRLSQAKPPIFHGADGVSQKAEGVGRASHYYSLTRLESEGTVTLGNETVGVSGLSWFDHEWATNQLSSGQTGWDWFSLQFRDGSELMIFQIRTADGGRDPYSSGTFIDSDGTVTAVKNSDFSLDPGRIWRSDRTGAEYPLEWTLVVPSLELELTIDARMDAQELVLDPISYWEGSVQATGSRRGKPVAGTGYLEMTGYAGPIVGMQANTD